MGGLAGEARARRRLSPVLWIEALDAVAPAPGRTCVWLVDTRSEAADAAVASVRATRADLEDAARWRDPERGAAGLARRRLLRALAARVLGCHASAVEIGRDPGGGSSVIAPRSLFASVARHRSWAALAVASSRVGVDLEPASLGAPLPVDLLPPALRRRVGTGAGSAQRFAQAWTSLEAYAKALGVGVHEVLSAHVADRALCGPDGPIFPQASCDLRVAHGLCAAVVRLDGAPSRRSSVASRVGSLVEAT